MTVVRMFQDGNQVCALIGSDLVEGLGGFGDTPADALRDLAANLENPDYKFSVTDLKSPWPVPRYGPNLTVVKKVDQ